MLVLLDTIAWPDVAFAAVGGLPATIAAVGVILNRRMLRTPSGKPIGEQVEDVNHTTIVTHHNVAALARSSGQAEVES